MTPNEFKSWKKVEFDEALKKRCDEEGLNLDIINKQLGETIYFLNNEAYVVINDGNKIEWYFAGMR